MNQLMQIGVDGSGRIVGFVEIDTPATRSLCLIGGVEIFADGTVVVPPSMTVTDAAKAFWSAVETMGFDARAAVIEKAAECCKPFMGKDPKRSSPFVIGQDTAAQQIHAEILKMKEVVS